jgi:ribonuclease R
MTNHGRVGDRTATTGRVGVDGFTIDPPGARDLDDALWAATCDDARDAVELSVSIADVAAAVAPSSPVAIKAKTRGFTRYHAGGNRPMLPHTLAEQRLSLLPGQARQVMTVRLQIGPDGLLGPPRLQRGVLVSRAQLTYAQAAAALQDRDHRLHPQLRLLWQAGQALLAQRRRKGALAAYDLSRGWATSEEGEPRELPAYAANAGYLIVTEAMIAANTAIADWLAASGLPALFRNHRASQLAADRAELLDDLAAALAHPNQRTRVAGTMRLVTQPATYGPQVQGHFGLNLPVYAHTTSPIRRFADLCNQWIVTAALHGDPLPLDFAALGELGEQLTILEREMKAARAAAENARARAAGRDALDHDRLDRLDPDGFSQALQVAAVDRRLTDGLVAAVRARLARDSGGLLARDALAIFLQAPRDDPGWQALREEAMAWAWRSAEVISVFSMASQHLDWPSPTVEVAEDGPDHARRFHATAHLTINSRPYSSATVEASSKQTARQRAHASLLAAITGLPATPPSPMPDQADPTPTAANAQPTASGDVTGDNAKGHLQERCQAERWPTPTYTSQQDGPAHLPRFSCTATLLLPDGQRQATGQGASKRDAEQHAAAALLAQLPTAHPSKAAAAPSNATAKSTLQEHCQRHGWPLPSYAPTAAGPPHAPMFACTVEVTTAAGRHTATGQGASKRDAEQQAAARLLERLPLAAAVRSHSGGPPQ